MVFDEKCRRLKEIAISRGWDGSFYDETEEELFDRGYPSVVEKTIVGYDFCQKIFGKNWKKLLWTMDSLPTIADKVDYMYLHKME